MILLLQLSGPDGPVTATWIHGRSPHLLSAKRDLTRTAVSARRTDVVTRPDKYQSWHGFKVRRQQLASQWPGEPAVTTKKSSKILQGGQRITIPSKLGHMHRIAWCAVIELLKTIHTQSRTENYWPN